jgi:phosphate transport system permease protein
VLTDTLLRWVIRVGAIVSALVMLFSLLFLLVESWPALQHIAPIRFFTDPSWHPLEATYNLLPMLSGTLYASMGALLLAVPLGIASALFIAYYASPRFLFVLHALDTFDVGYPSSVFWFLGFDYTGSTDQSVTSTWR